jgi:hypothetical protein
MKVSVSRNVTSCKFEFGEAANILEESSALIFELQLKLGAECSS